MSKDNKKTAGIRILRVPGPIPILEVGDSGKPVKRPVEVEEIGEDGQKKTVTREEPWVITWRDFMYRILNVEVVFGVSQEAFYAGVAIGLMLPGAVPGEPLTLGESLHALTLQALASAFKVPDSKDPDSRRLQFLGYSMPVFYQLAPFMESLTKAVSSLEELPPVETGAP